MTLGSLGPSTKFWRGAGRAMSDLELARDFEGHEAWGLGNVLTGHHDVDVLELSAALEVRHEVGHDGRRVRSATELEQELLLFEAGDPKVPGHGVDERIHERDRL